jgi:hypothetical protein
MASMSVTEIISEKGVEKSGDGNGSPQLEILYLKS